MQKILSQINTFFDGFLKGNSLKARMGRGSLFSLMGNSFAENKVCRLKITNQ